VTVLVLGATGRTGGRVLGRLLEGGVSVRALVRSAARLPAGVADRPGLEVVEADVTALPGAELSRHLAACDAVVSCLGHAVSLRGVFGPPRDLVARTVERVRDAVLALAPEAPLRFVLMSSVSVNRPGRADARRGVAERAFLWALRGLLPPAGDNQRAADALVAGARPALEWVVVRPYALIEGDASPYLVREGLVASLFGPDTTRYANVAHFMADLAADDASWRRWRGRMPLIVDGRAPAAA